MKYEIRKIRSNGNNTLLLSLPVGFANELGFHSGDYVKIEVSDNCLKISKTGL